MSDQWYYRMFGEQFGPVPIEKLKELADGGTIQALDQVRADGSGDWVAAATVDELGLSTSSRTTATLVEPTIEDFDFSAPPTASIEDFDFSAPQEAASIDDFDFSAPQAASIDDFDFSSKSPSSDDFDSSSSQSTSEKWFCRLGENELGPLTFAELVKFAEHEQLCADDQVRLGDMGQWRRAGSIGRLMAALPYKPVAKTIVPGAAKPIRERSALESSPSLDDFEIASSTMPATSGAATVRERDFTARQPVPAAAPAPDPEATFRVAYEQAKARLTETMLAQADAAFKVAEDQAKSQIAWATAPNVDKFWWGWAGGVEFGPVEFTQVFGLAKSGQLKPSDFVRNGPHGQFVPSSGVPGLFKAVEMIARATETRDLAKAQAQAAASLALPPPVVPMDQIKAAEKAVAAVHVVQQAKSNPFVSTPAGAIPRSNPHLETVRQPPKASSDPHISARDVDPEPEPDLEPSRPEPSRSTYNSAASMGGGFSSSNSSMSTYGMNRPTAIPRKPAARKPSGPRSTWFSDMLENLKEPKAIGSVCAIAFVMLIFGWNYLPKSRGADIKKYNAMKKLLDDVKTKRTNPAELATLQKEMEKVGKQFAAELKSKASREDRAKQCLLWAARDEIPALLQAGLGVESPAEQRLASRLKEASYELGLEKRPPVDLAQLAKANAD